MPCLIYLEQLWLRQLLWKPCLVGVSHREYSKENVGLHVHRLRKVLKSGGQDMASAEREPILGVSGRSSQRGRGAEPLVRGQEAKPPEAEAFYLLFAQRSRDSNYAPFRDSLSSVGCDLL